MPSKKPAESQQCQRSKMLKKTDDLLAEIDKSLGENTWDEPGRLPRPRGKRLGTTPHPRSRLGS